jgi:hypothetical protein
MNNAIIVRLLQRILAAIKRQGTQPEEPSVLMVLTIWQRGLLDKSWTDHVDGFDAVSIKCMDGSNTYRMGEAKETAREALTAGLSLHGWGYHYCLTEQRAIEEAEAAALACQDLGAVGYHWNAEKHWVEGGDPPSTAIAFSQAFKAIAPDVTLYANCFKDQATAAMLDHFDVFEPMCYGTKRKTIATKIKDRMERHDIPASKLGIMVGTGREETGKPDRAWGYLDGDGTNPGLLQLVSAHRPVIVNFFRAGRVNGEDIMVRANGVNPPLSEQVRRIRASMDGVVV